MGLIICKLNDLREIEYKNDTLEYIPIKHLNDDIKIYIEEYSYYTDGWCKNKKFVPSEIIDIDLTDKIWKKYNKWIGIDPRIYTKFRSTDSMIFEYKLKTMCEIYNQIHDFNVKQIYKGYNLHFAKPIVAKIYENPLPEKIFDLSEYLRKGTEIILKPVVSKKTKLSNNPIISAFSHFSYHNSDGNYLICPVEGDIDGNDFYLAVPNVHKHHIRNYKGSCRNGNSQYNLKNHGSVGIALFFSHHICTKLCENFKKPDMTDEFKEKIKKLAEQKNKSSIHYMRMLARKYSRKIYDGKKFCDANKLEYIINPPKYPKYCYDDTYKYTSRYTPDSTLQPSPCLGTPDLGQLEIEKEKNNQKYQYDLWHMNNYDSYGRNYNNDPFACR
jgi:hypothetical protein